MYLPSEHFDSLLTPNAEGLPPLYLKWHNGALWLAEETTGLLVNVGNRSLRKLGIWSVSIRGSKYYPQDSTRIGPATLVREPDNPHDKNAVAVDCGGTIIGHYNKQMAVGLARALDGGATLDCYIVSVGPDNPIKAIAAESSTMAHLFRHSA